MAVCLLSLLILSLTSSGGNKTISNIHDFQAAYADDHVLDDTCITQVLLYLSKHDVCLRNHRRRSHTVKDSCRRKFHTPLRTIGRPYLMLSRTTPNSPRVRVGFRQLQQRHTAETTSPSFTTHRHSTRARMESTDMLWRTPWASSRGARRANSSPRPERSREMHTHETP